MSPLYADLVVTGGTVLTLDGADTVAEAVAVSRGRIAAVGAASDVEGLIGPRTQVVRLGGTETVVPGFIDAHNHLMRYGHWLAGVNAKAPTNRTVGDVLERVKERAGQTRPGEWVLGFGVEEGALEEGRGPTRDELDAAAPEHPVYLIHRAGRAGVASSRALALAGLTDAVGAVEGGHLDRDTATGRLTGLLREEACAAVEAVLPRPSKDQLKGGVIAAGKLYAAAGITSVHDAGAGARPEPYRAYQEAVQDGWLKQRVYLMIAGQPGAHFYLDHDLGLRTGFGDERLRLGAVTVRVDGTLALRTAALHEPYLDGEGAAARAYPRGLLAVTPNELNALVLDAHVKGYQVALEAQGDYGIDMALDALQHAQWKAPRSNARHRIEQPLGATPDALRRMRRLGVVASFSPQQAWYWAEEHARSLGAERAERVAPIASALALGISTVLHSGAPEAAIGDPHLGAEPLFGIWCAVNRVTRSGAVAGPAERLTALDALRAYTIRAAHAAFEEGLKGSIEEGKLADLVVLDRNPCAIDPSVIRDVRILRTIIGGETVHEA
jgi:predicted amidohydrolase YtcJ